MKDDSGQTTVPFFDAVPVLSNPPTPLGGIGMFMKGITDVFPGLISLRLHSMNYDDYMKNPQKELNDEVEFYSPKTSNEGLFL